MRLEQHVPTSRSKFGESANNEMCFFWAYYYPSKGAYVCVHTDAGGRPRLLLPRAPVECAFFAQFASM